MAETEGKASKGSRFLKKSKWGKIFKEDEAPAASPARQGTFKLTDDVVDFLKPSSEKTMPKLDIAIAQRWPNAHEVRTASAGVGSPFPPPTAACGRPRKGKGLSVRFVQTAPDVIGEGGDEAADPPAEISRTKAMVSRSASEKRPSVTAEANGWPGATQNDTSRQAKVPQGSEQDFRPAPLRRVQTSHNEFSPALQRKHMSPPLEPPEPVRPTLGRTPTGFSQLGTLPKTPVDTPLDGPGGPLQDRPPFKSRPSVETRFSTSENQQLPLGNSPRDTDSPVALKQREMRSSEGMALKRASLGRPAHREDEPDSYRPPPSKQYTSSSMATSVPEIFSPQAHEQSPDTALSPSGPNPFADPKYYQRHSREASAESHAVPLLPHEPFSQHQSTANGIRGEASQNPFAFEDQSPVEARHRPLPQTDTSHVQKEGMPPTQPSYPHTTTRAHVTPLLPPSRNIHDDEKPSHGVPSYIRGSSNEEQRQPTLPQLIPLQQPSIPREMRQSEQPSYMRAVQPPNPNTLPPEVAAPYPNSQSMNVPQQYSDRDTSRSPGMRDRVFDSAGATALPLQKPRPFYDRPNGSSSSINHFSPTSDSPTSSIQSPQLLRPSGGSGHELQPPPSPGYRHFSRPNSSHNQSPRSSQLGPGRGGVTPTIMSASPTDYFSGPKSATSQPPRSPLAALWVDDRERSGSSGPHHSIPLPSPLPPSESNPAADAAFADFAGRVAHMKGVFRLTAEKECPADRCPPTLWLRAALWWHLRGKSGVELLLQQRQSRDVQGSPREFLTQAHVDLAKSWWILTESLEHYNMVGDVSPQTSRSGESAEMRIQRAVSSLRNHLKALSLSMAKGGVLPPTQSLIQGQDTRVWLEYPRFDPAAAAVLGGTVSRSSTGDSTAHTVDPLEMLPLGDTRDVFCYGRFPVEVYTNTDEAETDRINLPCSLSLLRGRRDYQTSLVVASQSELVNVRITPRQDEQKGLTWHDVSWKANSSCLVIHLPRGFDLTVRMQERDFRSVRGLTEYARGIENTLRAGENEMLVHESRLAELQYADSSNSHAFPAEKIRGCMALIFERRVPQTFAGGTRKMHRGSRMLLVTDPAHKSLSSASHELCNTSPLFFEFMTDSAANGTTAMVLRVREESRQCRILFVFPDMASRQSLYDVLNGLSVDPDETIVAKVTLTALNIEPASQVQGSPQSARQTLHGLQWQKLGVTNSASDDPNSRLAGTVESENLRIVARHTTGCITDRLNLNKGDLLLRLPCSDPPTSIQVFRQPQEDLTMSIDTRATPPPLAEGLGQLYSTMKEQPTIRTFTFASAPDLHAFQASITGFTVRYDGLAATLGIARRRMVVPIYKTWEAKNVRVQIVARESVVLFVAFFEDFSHADALCFRILGTDTFEASKGKWSVKLVDAKFSLPGEWSGEEERARRRFVNLEGLEYAEEHDDVSIGFGSEEERDLFAKALPAATSVSRGITLKRRI